MSFIAFVEAHQGELGRLRSGSQFLKVQDRESMRMDLPAMSRRAKGRLGPEDIRQVMTHKGPDWSHERAWRILIPRERYHTSRADDNHPAQLHLANGLMQAFLRIEPESITKVIPGYRSSPQLPNTELQIKAAKKAKWKVFRARLRLDSHSFDKELIEC